MAFKQKTQTNESTDLVGAVTTLPADFDMSTLAGDGSEEIGIDDLPRPALKLLAATSPECTIGDESHVEGAQAGMFYNAGTRRLYTNVLNNPDKTYPPLVFIPVKYRLREIEYGRNRGGFKGEHFPKSEITKNLKIVIDEQDRPHRITVNDTELVDTSIFFGLTIDPVSYEPTQSIISLSISGKKFAKNFNSYIKNLRDRGINGNVYEPAMYSRAYTLYSTFKPDPGPHWLWGFKLNQKLDPLNDSHRKLIAAAMDYKRLIESDSVNIAHNGGE